MLLELADFFETSVDALLGHTISADRKQDKLNKMEALSDEGRYDEAKELAQMLLRNYPNDYDVVSKVADLYYRSYEPATGNSDMEYAIQLTKRLFALLEDSSGMKRFQLLSRLGNQYELLRDWEMARKYYEESNVAGVNNRALARMLADEGKLREASEAITEEFTQDLFNLLLNLLSLHKVWRDLGEMDKAEAALDWGIRMLSTAGKGIAASYAPMLVILYAQKISLAKELGEKDKVRACGAAAIALIEKREENTSPDFLTGNHKKLLVSSNLNTPDLICQLMEESGPGSEFVLSASRK